MSSMFLHIYSYNTPLRIHFAMTHVFNQLAWPCLAQPSGQTHTTINIFSILQEYKHGKIYIPHNIRARKNICVFFSIRIYDSYGICVRVCSIQFIVYASFLCWKKARARERERLQSHFKCAQGVCLLHSIAIWSSQKCISPGPTEWPTNQPTNNRNNREKKNDKVFLMYVHNLGGPFVVLLVFFFSLFYLSLYIFFFLSLSLFLLHPRPRLARVYNTAQSQLYAHSFYCIVCICEFVGLLNTHNIYIIVLYIDNI